MFNYTTKKRFGDKSLFILTMLKISIKPLYKNIKMFYNMHTKCVYEDLIMIEKIRCIDANAKELAIISNSILKKSRKFAEQALSKGLISSQEPKFTQDSVKTFYNIGDFYEKTGEIKESAKPVFAHFLKEFGLRQNATLAEFRNFVLGVYK